MVFLIVGNVHSIACMDLCYHLTGFSSHTEGKLLRNREYIGMNVYWFGLAFMWNGLHPIILPALLLQFAPETLKNTYLGAFTFIGLFLAMVVQPLSGAVSDRSRARWGRRRPWMFWGTLFSVLFLLAMGQAGSLLGLLGAYLLLQLASNTAHGPAQGLIPDLVPSARRGLASGIKNLFDMSGLIVTSLVMGQLMGDDRPVLAFTVISVVLVVSASITLLTTKESPIAEGEKAQDRTGLRDLLRVDLRNYPDFTRLLIARFFILFGIFAVQGFAQYYIQDWLGEPNPAQVTGNLLATIGVTLTVLVFPAGYLSDRFGRVRLNVFSGALAALGIFLLIFVRDVNSLYLFGGIIGMATGIFLSVNWALATDLVPLEEAGKYLGLTNLATAGAAAASRAAGPLIDGLNALYPGRYLGYPVLFVLTSVIPVLGVIVLRQIREKVR
jgi:Na+/melibiose symporter-like transporter